jgi:hypothetical protein
MVRPAPVPHLHAELVRTGVVRAGEGNTYAMYIGLGTLLIVILLLILIF